MRRDKPLSTHFPPHALWTGHGRTRADPVRSLSAADIDALLAAGSVQFALADGGFTLDWVSRERAAAFWTAEVRPRLIGPDEDVPTASAADPTSAAARLAGYGYRATEWMTERGEVVILLEKHRS